MPINHAAARLRLVLPSMRVAPLTVPIVDRLSAERAGLLEVLTQGGTRGAHSPVQAFTSAIAGWSYSIADTSSRMSSVTDCRPLYLS